jgi:hypothetical protein
MNVIFLIKNLVQCPRCLINDRDAFTRFSHFLRLNDNRK